jgi:hypothetical protein
VAACVDRTGRKANRKDRYRISAENAKRFQFLISFALGFDIPARVSKVAADAANWLTISST